MFEIIEDCLPINDFRSLYDFLDPTIPNDWVLSNRVFVDGVVGKVSWCHDRKQYWSLPFLNASVTIKYKIQKIIKKPLVLTRIHSNGQTSGQLCGFHQDCPEPDKMWTVVLFTTPSWNSQWSGEFMCYTEGQYKIAPYIPNNAVLIKAEEQHNANTPNGYTDSMRTTVAFTYGDANTCLDIYR